MARGFSEETAKRMERMSGLALSFPSLAKLGDYDALGIDPWDPDRLEQWALGPEPSSSERHIVRFLLSLWDTQASWRSGWFDMHVALADWDEPSRAAFAKWAAKPWWP